MKIKLFLFVIIYCFSFQDAEAIQHIRWGSNGDPLNGLTVTWRNAGTSDSIRWGYTSSYELGRFAGIKRNGYAEYIFKYVFPTANPNSTIFYRLYDSKTNSWTSQMTYLTAPPSNTSSFSFLGVGDSRTNVSVWSQVASQSNTKNADFALYTGDIVNSGGTGSQWDDWFNNGTQYISNNLVYHSHGNHEAVGNGTAVYQNLFELPQTNGTSLYYSFAYGNALFISLNSEDPTSAAQNTWLTNTLQANQSKTWKIVYFHRPFYTIGKHAGEMNAYFNTWWKAFDDYGVDLIINGHDHMYERSKPINRKISTTAPVSTYGSSPGQGRCEIVTGGAGAPLYTGTPTWFIQKYQSAYNFCHFDVIDCKIKVTAYTNTGAVLDTFSLNKCTPTGVEDISVQTFNPISIIPNPVENSFVLNYSSDFIGDALVKIYDLAGREVVSESVKKNQTNLEFEYNMSSYPKGAYTILVIAGKHADSALMLLK